jgi:hypothetical protein
MQRIILSTWELCTWTRYSLNLSLKVCDNGQFHIHCKYFGHCPLSEMYLIYLTYQELSLLWSSAADKHAVNCWNIMYCYVTYISVDNVHHKYNVRNCMLKKDIHHVLTNVQPLDPILRQFNPVNYIYTYFSLQEYLEFDFAAFRSSGSVASYSSS